MHKESTRARIRVHVSCGNTAIHQTCRMRRGRGIIGGMGGLTCGPREYLTEGEVERRMEAAKANR